MTPPRPFILFALVLSAVLSGCQMIHDAGDVRPMEGITNPSIHVLFDTTRALPVTGAFGWGLRLARVAPEHKVSLSDVEERLHRSLREALSAKGFTYTNQDPDYLVGFALLSGASMDEAELNAAYGTLLSFPDRADSAPPLNYSTGVLIVDIVARETGRLLWRGAIKADIDLTLPDERKQARCDDVVRELLRHYPYPARSR